MDEGKFCVLVVDDEQAVLDLLVYNLKKAQYHTLTANNGKDALNLISKGSIDLVLLDIMLPGMDGLDVCREIRQKSGVPIIMLTARGEEIDRVVGLELGADDYICKPFGVREVLARVKAVLRRSDNEGPKDKSLLKGAGNLVLDPEKREVWINDREVNLTRLEFDLLLTLLSHPGRVFTRQNLLEQVWGYEYTGDTRAVDSAIKRLRAGLRTANPNADRIEAVRGLGYKYDGL